MPSRDLELKLDKSRNLIDAKAKLEGDVFFMAFVRQLTTDDPDEDVNLGRCRKFFSTSACSRVPRRY